MMGGKRAAAARSLCSQAETGLSSFLPGALLMKLPLIGEKKGAGFNQDDANPIELAPVCLTGYSRLPSNQISAIPG